jgi:hypothetical protein
MKLPVVDQISRKKNKNINNLNYTIMKFDNGPSNYRITFLQVHTEYCKG